MWRCSGITEIWSQTFSDLISSWNAIPLYPLDVIGTKIKNLFLPPSPLSKSGLKLICNGNIENVKPMRTLKIFPRNLNEIVRAWFRLLFMLLFVVYVACILMCLHDDEVAWLCFWVMRLRDHVGTAGLPLPDLNLVPPQSQIYMKKCNTTFWQRTLV